MKRGEGEEGRSIHAGHRKRMKEEFRLRGLEGMSEYRVMELLLFYAIPQGDVNPLAHRLVDRFGGLAGVFNATSEQLMAVPGVGHNTALLLTFMPQLAARYQDSSYSLEGQVVGTWQLQELLVPLFLGARNEKVFLVCLDSKDRLITCRQIHEGIADRVDVSARKIVEIALGCGARRVVLAHNHLSGIALCSAADVQATRQLRTLLAQMEICLVDHVVVADGDMVSMVASGYIPAWGARP